MLAPMNRNSALLLAGIKRDNHSQTTPSVSFSSSSNQVEQKELHPNKTNHKMAGHFYQLLALCLAMAILPSIMAQHYGGGGGHHHQAKFPPGVSPHACPNYPYCHPLVDPRGGHHYGGGSGYAAAPSHHVHGGYGGHHGHGAGIGAGAKYPASFDPHSCPNYPYCHNNPGGHGYGAGHGYGHGGGHYGKK